MRNNAHGVNLVVDKEHYKRMKGVAADIVKIIQDDLKELNDAFVFIETHISNQTVMAQTIQKKIEALEIKTDFIGHKIIDTDSSTTAAAANTADILSVGGQAVTPAGTQSQAVPSADTKSFTTESPTAKQAAITTATGTPPDPAVLKDQIDAMGSPLTNPDFDYNKWNQLRHQELKLAARSGSAADQQALAQFEADLQNPLYQ
jgi:hypothetical protein